MSTISKKKVKKIIMPLLSHFSKNQLFLMPNQMPTIISMEFYTSDLWPRPPLFLNLPKPFYKATKSAAPNSPILSTFFPNICFVCFQWNPVLSQTTTHAFSNGGIGILLAPHYYYDSQTLLGDIYTKTCSFKVHVSAATPIPIFTAVIYQPSSHLPHSLRSFMPS